jgi:hypothetical protein
MMVNDEIKEKMEAFKTLLEAAGAEHVAIQAGVLNWQAGNNWYYLSIEPIKISEDSNAPEHT